METTTAFSHQILLRIVDAVPEKSMDDVGREITRLIGAPAPRAPPRLRPLPTTTG